MARRADTTWKPPGRVRVTIERIVLGTAMALAAYLVERRFRKAVVRAKPSGTGGVGIAERDDGGRG